MRSIVLGIRRTGRAKLGLAWLGRRLSAAGTSASRRCVIGVVCASGSVALTRQLGRHRPAPIPSPPAAAEGTASPPSPGDAFGGGGGGSGAEGGGGDGGNTEGQRTYSTEYVPVRCSRESLHVPQWQQLSGARE